MNRVFADSFYFLALANRRDASHQRALDLASQLGTHIVTTAWVLTEVADAFSSPKHRNTVITLFRALESDPNVPIIDASSQLFKRAIELFEARSDKSWTLTDYTSFIVMNDLGIADALTGDHHFAQAGFRLLLAG